MSGKAPRLDLTGYNLSSPDVTLSPARVLRHGYTAPAEADAETPGRADRQPRRISPRLGQAALTLHHTRPSARSRMAAAGDHLEVYGRLVLWDHQRGIRTGLQFAFYRPYAVPRLAEVFDRTGYIYREPVKRHSIRRLPRIRPPTGPYGRTLGIAVAESSSPTPFSWLRHLEEFLRN